MPFITSPKTILGLDISDLSVKAVQISEKAGQKYIRAINACAVPDGFIDDGEIKNNDGLAEIIKGLIKNAPKKFSTKYAAISLPETKTFIKVIEVPPGDMPVAEAIRQELPRHVPIANEEMQIDWQEIEQTKANKKFLVGAVPKKITDEYIGVAEMAGLTPVALEIEAQAIARCLLPFETPKDKKQKTSPMASSQPKIIVDFGATRTSLIFIDRGVIQFTNSLPNISGQKITETISERLDLSKADAEKAKIICGTNPKKCKGATMKIINDTINELAKEIANADNFYQTHFGQEASGLTVVLGGGGANMVNLDKTLNDKLGREVSYGDPLTNVELKGQRRDDQLSFATAIGLALRNFNE